MIARPRPSSDEGVIRIDGGEHDAAEQLLAWGWTDGLPIVVPTVERVERMCAGALHQADEPLGHIAPRGAPITLRHLAAISSPRRRRRQRSAPARRRRGPRR